jgi:transcriptional regulator with XRE-family HTH domain
MSDATIADKKAVLRRKIVGVKVRHARTRAGLNLKEVGQVLGLSADTVSEIEYGRRDVSLPELEAMAYIFGVPILYFWAEDVVYEPDLAFPVNEAIGLRRRIIGVLLRQARSETGHTQDELAGVVGVSAQTIANYEFGRSDIPLPKLELLADYLNRPISYFLDQGMHANGNGPGNSLDDLANYSQLSPEIKEFLSNPANVLYINIAMKLSEVSAHTLRSLAEGLLEVTY